MNEIHNTHEHERRSFLYLQCFHTHTHTRTYTRTHEHEINSTHCTLNSFICIWWPSALHRMYTFGLPWKRVACPFKIWIIITMKIISIMFLTPISVDRRPGNKQREVFGERKLHSVKRRKKKDMLTQKLLNLFLRHGQACFLTLATSADFFRHSSWVCF